MKKSLLILSLIVSANAFAGSIDYLAQQDAEYFAHPSMIGKIGVSGAYYNPAGTVFLEDGLYVQLNSQTLLKNYEMETVMAGTDKLSHESDHPTLFVPSIQIVKKEGDRSYFLHAGAAAGGGKVKYDNGISAFEVIGQGIQATFNKGNSDLGLSPNNGTIVKYLGGSTVNGSSYYFNTTFGMAQKINSKFSIAGGLRMMYVTRELNGSADYNLNIAGQSSYKDANIHVDIDSERTGWGVGGVIGFNYQPTDRLNIGFKYESEVHLNLDADGSVNAKNVDNSILIGDPSKDKLIAGGITESLRNEGVIKEWLVDANRNLPAMMALGVSYQLTDRITLLTSGNYYFIKDANTDNPYDHYDNGYEVSVGVDYKLNDKWTLMAGYQYTDTGANEHTYKDTDYALDADMYGAGVKYTPDETKEFLISYAYVDYKNGTAVDGKTGAKTTTFKKQVDAIALSATFKF